MRGSDREPSELELSLHVRFMAEPGGLRGEKAADRPVPWTNGETLDVGEEEAIDSSSSKERVCHPFCTFTIAYFSLVRSC